ncbi:MAG: nuclear transport factor 2 family protein [Bradymonadaceae bacterium]|nr:nuclear transport factor 2 family protein [Lujinxingiaceae bacterium]
MNVWSLLVCAMLVLIGCQNSPSNTAAPVAAEASVPQVTEVPGAPRSPVAEKAEVMSDIEEARVRELLASWLEAQNEGDFEGYAELYAERFYGIRRSGERIRRFDREGWLADRQRMFQMPMQVEAKDVQITSSPHMAVVIFEQTWGSGTYQDVGRKQLVVVRDVASLRLAREEMLDSVVVAPSEETGGYGLSDVAFLLQAGAHRYVVLDAQPGTMAWDWAAPEIVRFETTALAEVVYARVPERLRAYQGSAVTLYGAHGVSCQAQLGQIFLHSRASPTFGAQADWEGQGHEGNPPTEEAEIARWTFEMGVPIVVARVEGTDCADKGAIWARSQAVATPVVVYEPLALSKAVREAVLASFEGLTPWREEQRAFKAELPALKQKWMYYDGAKPVVTAFRSPSGHTFANVVAHAGQGCGGYEGLLWILFERQADASWKVVSDTAARQSYFHPATAIDLDASGHPVFVGSDHDGQEMIYRRQGENYKQATRLTIMDYACRC